MRILIACEESGVVRTEFARLGHSVASCDLLPSRIPGPHYQCDVLKRLGDGWDMMIAFPPCTHLCVSGARWFKKKKTEQWEAIMFFTQLIYAPIPLIAVENPVGIMSTLYRKPDQIIQPYQFGHPESKKTCLWLKGLPLLKPTKVLPLPECGHWDNQTPSGQNKLGPSEDRARIRSTTYKGIAKAMAKQWSAYAKNMWGMR